jgi:uncharacterized protein
MGKFLLILASFLIIFFFIPSVFASQGHMKLLAVTETEDGDVGGVADLYLEIKPGSGRVFLETFPLTRVDTQVSTRFAKEIACDFADVDCNKFDFFYTITADSSIIGGPSAGAAISALTFSLIRKVKLDETIAITGTINSGGVIGPVGGIKAKIKAAETIGLRKVLTPIGDLAILENISKEIRTNNSNLSNKTTALINETNQSIKFPKIEKIIEVKEVATLDEALYELTGRNFKEKNINITINEVYRDTMKQLAIQLCSRSTKLRNSVGNFSQNVSNRIYEDSINFSDRGKQHFNSNKYYSAASYCFGSNIGFNHVSLIEQNLSVDEVRERIDSLKQEIDKFDMQVEGEKLTTVTDLESYMVVKERLLEAIDFVEITSESTDRNETNLRTLAYAQERLNSAYSWSEFLGKGGKQFDFNKEIIHQACRKKLSEVEERLQYVQLYLPQDLTNTRKELEYAYKDQNEGNYELCLFKASKAKANADTVMSVFGVDIENVGSVVDRKLEIVERNLVEETEKGVFPILGYSYFEYANSLKEEDPFSALLYSEYALELSNLDIYFKNPIRRRITLFDNIDLKTVGILIVGMILGIFFSKLISFRKSRK